MVWVTDVLSFVMLEKRALEPSGSQPATRNQGLDRSVSALETPDVGVPLGGALSASHRLSRRRRPRSSDETAWSGWVAEAHEWNTPNMKKI